MQAIERGQAINITNDSNLGVKEQPSSYARNTHLARLYKSPGAGNGHNRSIAAAGASFIRTLQSCKSLIEQNRFTEHDFPREILV